MDPLNQVVGSGVTAPSSLWGGILLFTYTVLEVSFCRIYKRSSNGSRVY